MNEVDVCRCGSERLECHLCGLQGCANPQCLDALPWRAWGIGRTVVCLDCYYTAQQHAAADA